MALGDNSKYVSLENLARFKGNLDGSAGIASVSEGVVTIKAGVTQADGIIDNSTGSDITLAKAATTGAAEDISYDGTTSGLSATDVQAAIDAVAAASAGGVDSKTVYLQDESAGQSAYAKVYKLYQGADSSDMTQNVLVGTINVPLDQVVQDGHLVTVENGVDSDGDTAPIGTADGTYVKLTLQNVAQPIYINVQDLVDVYTGGTTAEATVAISNTNEITVTINKIAATKVIYQAADATEGLPEITVKAKIDSLETKIGTDIASAIGALDATESQTAGTDGLALSITETDGVITSISGSIAAETYDEYGAASTALTTAEGYTDSAIAALDASESQTAGADGLALSITEVDGVITAISGSIAANTYEAYGTTSTAIAALDATVSQTADTTNGLNLQVVEADGVITGVSGSIVTATNAEIDALFGITA